MVSDPRMNQLMNLNQQGASSAPIPPWLNPNAPGIPKAPDPLGIGSPPGLGPSAIPRTEGPPGAEGLAELMAQAGPPPGDRMGGAPPPGGGAISDAELQMLMAPPGAPPGMGVPPGMPPDPRAMPPNVGIGQSPIPPDQQMNLPPRGGGQFRL